MQNTINTSTHITKTQYTYYQNAYTYYQNRSNTKA